ncbi:hypothetical protein AB0N20_27380 [Streptomyces griseoincarnatus]
MRRALLPAFILAGAYLTGGAFLAHAAAVTVNHGDAPLTAGVLLSTSGLSLFAAYSTATGPLRTRPPRPRVQTCRCDRWWTSLGTDRHTSASSTPQPPDSCDPTTGSHPNTAA